MGSTCFIRIFPTGNFYFYCEWRNLDRTTDKDVLSVIQPIVMNFWRDFRCLFVRDVYIFILSHDTDKIKIETYIICTPYMEVVTPRQDLLSNIGTRISWIKVKNRVSIIPSYFRRRLYFAGFSNFKINGIHAILGKRSGY